jgi:hypothetical protein
MKVLKQHHLEENTLVLYTSDNGPWLNMGNHGGSALPFREGKGTAFEGGVRVPCIVRWPGHVAGPREFPGIASTLDILPTVCAITGAPLPEKRIDGVNLLPVLNGERDTSPRTTYFFYYDAELRAVREDQWKLHFPHTTQSYEGMTPGQDGYPGRTTTRKVGLELYDLSRDPGERNDVALLYPEVVRRLELLGDGMRRDLGDRLTGTRGDGVRPPGRVGAGRTSRPHAAIGAQVTYDRKYHGRYTGGGDAALVDGRHASTDFQDSLWQGFEGSDLEVVIDLHRVQTIGTVTVTFLENQYSWIFLPREVRVAASNDGKVFRPIRSLTSSEVRPTPELAIREIAMQGDSIVARYLRVVARNQGTCPEWHPGAGGTAWLFVDEIDVR